MPRRSDIRHPNAPYRRQAPLKRGTLPDLPVAPISPTGEEWAAYEQTLPMFFDFGHKDGEPTRIVPFSRTEGLLFHDLARLLASRIRRCDMSSWSRNASDHDISLVYKMLVDKHPATVRKLLLETKFLINSADSVLFSNDKDS